jgi:hypothetical protein
MNAPCPECETARTLATRYGRAMCPECDRVHLNEVPTATLAEFERRVVDAVMAEYEAQIAFDCDRNADATARREERQRLRGDISLAALALCKARKNALAKAKR